MADPAPIDFYFEFSSPYGYLASLRIDDIAAKHGRKAVWRPFLLGVVFQITGHSPLTNQPLRGDYARLDFDRSAPAKGAVHHAGRVPCSLHCGGAGVLLA
jgi:2-hydroxychromene-2-carboxylate isomerase